MTLDGKKVAVLVEDVYEDLELWYPYYRLKEEGVEVTLVGPEAGKTYGSKYGYPATSDRAGRDVSGADLDGVVIPGGYAPDKMRRYPELLAIVRDAFDAGKVVASICHGPWVLCSADVLRDRRATGVSAIKDDMVNAGAQWEDAEVVCDGKLITSRTPKDLPAFMKAIIAEL